MPTSQKTTPENFYSTYNGSIDPEQIDIAFVNETKVKLNQFITNVSIVKTENGKNDSNIALSGTYAKKLHDMLDDDNTGLGGKKQIAGTARKVLEATSESADVIAKIWKGEDVAVNAVRVSLEIGGTFIGAIMPPPYGEALNALLGLASTFLAIATEKREPSFKNEVAELLRDFEYSELQAQYATKTAQIKQISTAMSENLTRTDLPNRTPTTMQYAGDFVNDKFEATLISWANSDCFNKSFFDKNSGSWTNKSAALGRAKIMNLAYEYICTKKLLLQGLICLLENTKSQIRKSNMAPNLRKQKLVQMDEHLHFAQIAFSGLDDSLMAIVNDTFSKLATRETVVMYAALHAMPNFAHMWSAYKKITGTAPKYEKPFNINVPIKIINRGVVPTEFGAKKTGKSETTFRLRVDPEYPGCFRLVSGEKNVLWWSPSQSSTTDLEQWNTVDPLVLDDARFIFIKTSEEGMGTWYFITIRSNVMDASSELSTFCSTGPFTLYNVAGKPADHLLVEQDIDGGYYGAASHYYPVRKF